MKRILLITLSALFLYSCTTSQDVDIAEIDAGSRTDIAKEETRQETERTKQLELELKILQEQNK